MMRVKGKIALVTGGAGGIGAECCRVLAREGATVVVADLVEDAGKAVAAETNGEFRRLDVSSLSSWQELVNDIVAKHGSIDVMVHCAGIEGSLEEGGLETSEAIWNKVISVNLTGTFWGCKTVVPEMVKKGVGSIILLSSITSFMATSSATPYGVSKAGVHQLAKTVAMIGAKDGAKVRCNSVHPGVIKSRMTDNIIAELARAQEITEEESELALLADTPLGTRGKPEDVANMVLFLASEESAYVTGSDFKVDGGWLVVDAG